MSSKIIIGVDLGGTKIMTGTMSPDGKVPGTPVKVQTGGAEPVGRNIKRITNSVELSLSNIGLSIADVMGIGIGATGPLDIDGGVILECPQLPTMNFFPLRKTIEDFISGAGVSKIFKSISVADKSSLDVFHLAVKGDEQALQTWKEFGADLAVPLSWSINMIDPDIVVIGGSITSAYNFFKISMEEILKKWICPGPSQKTKIVPAESGDFAGFIGAACLVIGNN